MKGLVTVVSARDGGPPSTVLGFAILVGVGVAISGWALLRPRPAA